MSLQHFYLEDQVIADETEKSFELRLSPDDVKHARVLRMGAGEHIAVVDADKDYFEIEVERFDAEGMVVHIARHLESANERPQVILVQGLAKGDKMDDVIRHATELGVSAFIPLECARSVMRLDPKKAPKKVERWQSIAKSGAMQSGQPAIPQVMTPMKPKAAADLLKDCTAILVCWEEAPTSLNLGTAIRNGLKQHGQERKDAVVALVVGPEGGLTDQEVQLFLDSSDTAALVSLGSSILRTETAGIVAPALALYELGCLGG